LSKIDEAKEILRSLGLPTKQQNERSALTLLALAQIRPNGSWKGVQQPMLRIWDILEFMRDRYGKRYAANTRETIRRQTIHQFEQARIMDRNPDDPSRPTNSGKNCYALTNRAMEVLKAYRTDSFDDQVAAFIKDFGSLQEAYSRQRRSRRAPLTLPAGATVYFYCIALRIDVTFETARTNNNQTETPCVSRVPRSLPGIREFSEESAC
jgi:adenine-specific DNA-methyltransferase